GEEILQRDSPVELAGGADGHQTIAGQKDDLPALALAERNGGRVARRIVEALPLDLAAVLVEGGEGGFLRTDVDENIIALDQRRAGDAEAEVRGREVLGRVHGPNLFAVLGVRATEQARDAEGVEFAVVEVRRRARSNPELADELVMQGAAI